MLIAGHETTVHLLGNAIVALCAHRDQLALAIERDLWPQVVEETLRYRGPVLGSPFRYTVTDTILAGVPIPAGEALWLSLAYHGTEHGRYGDTADRFDITREQNGYLGDSGSARTSASARRWPGWRAASPWRRSRPAR